MANEQKNFGDVDLEAALLELVPIDKRIGPIELMVKPMSPEKEKEISDLSDKDDREGLVSAAKDLIAGWNLKKEGLEIPLDAETLEFYWPRLCKVRVEVDPDLFKGVEDEQTLKAVRQAGNFLLSRVLIFAGRIENFLKN